MYMCTVFPLLNVSLSCFKQLPLKFTCILLSVYLIAGERLLSGALTASSDSPVHFDDEILSVLPIFLKCFYIG